MTPTPAQPAAKRRRFRIHHLAQAKAEGRKLTMLTAYDFQTAQVFDEAGLDLLLVGDSYGNNMLGYDSTIPVTLEDMMRATSAVARGAHYALVVADMPFGSYEDTPAHAFRSAARLMKAGAQAVKLEGGRPVAPQVKLLTEFGIPVIGHLGFTPQSENALGGPRIQGREDGAAQRLLDDALALQEAGAAAIVLELMPAATAAFVTSGLKVPTIGIGAGPDCDGQVLVWTDMSGLSASTPKFVKTFGNLRKDLVDAASAYALAVRRGTYPDPGHSY
ncbi:MAG: 3-methyl-2-oxobutanoate hydroxymethyltransferase [Bifidobacteriaceae bacterium]|jgi:3-methyl-2-oxobutanoate hydroxymethyltransferase|nr:3-methyl-2-oxobutanoate hydroxymethyltransferase [Bifidobacteriaceae bacterium]